MGNGRASPANAWAEPRLGRLCEVAAAAISPGRRDSSQSISSRSCEEDEAEDTTDRVAHEFRVVEVDAFASVHDMIHAAIASYGKEATLREIYRACQQRGRIAYKRSGGSRLITHNDHWKSQIRHALYTCDRFARAANAHDLWTVSAAYSKSQPQTTKVLIRTDPDAASVNDDSADAQRRHGKQPSRQVRSKHTLEEPLLQATPKQKRSRTTRVAAKRASPGSSAATRSRADLGDTPSASIARSNGQNHVLSASDFSEMGDRAGSTFQPYSYDASTAAGTTLLQHEGEDESSYNDTAMPQVYVHDSLPTSFEPGIVVQPSGVVHRGCSGLPVVDVHPYFTECHDAHQIVATAAGMQNQSTCPTPGSALRNDQPFVFAPHRYAPLPPQLPPSHIPHTLHQQNLPPILSADAQSPAETQVYSLRSRLAPRVSAQPPIPQHSPVQPQKPLHKVHHFFTCHNQQGSQPQPTCQLETAPSYQSSRMPSNVPQSPTSRPISRQGIASRPPALPRCGRTELLLAAAHKAQTTAFPMADQTSCEESD